MRLFLAGLFFWLFAATPLLAFEVRVGFNNTLESSLTACEKPVQYLLKDVTAPCTGYLFSPEMEYKMRIQNETYENLEALTQKQDDLILILKDRAYNAEQHNVLLLGELNEKKTMSFWTHIATFTLGAVITGFIAANVNK